MLFICKSLPCVCNITLELKRHPNGTGQRRRRGNADLGTGAGAAACGNVAKRLSWTRCPAPALAEPGNVPEPAALDAAVEAGDEAPRSSSCRGPASMALRGGSRLCPPGRDSSARLTDARLYETSPGRAAPAADAAGAGPHARASPAAPAGDRRGQTGGGSLTPERAAVSRLRRRGLGLVLGDRCSPQVHLAVARDVEGRTGAAPERYYGKTPSS